MNIIPMLLKEMEQEAQTTRKFLERVPNDKYDWRPHEKSMTIRNLATHIAELPAWVTMALTTDGLDFAENPYQPEVINDNEALLELFERSHASGSAELAKTNEDELLNTWTLSNGGQVLVSSSKAETIRMAFCQTVHHRAQLGVFLRLLNVPIYTGQLWSKRG
jgi:uncharacterized damage-inducible protein DinB